jgi:chemosensory pili system protein ChpA (sensor histidine kinase/response regulator)
LRTLSGTADDLTSVRSLLGDLRSESEDLLQQQGRIIDELQDGLRRTGMVPFVQMVPRLRRLVRQTARQLGKKARLEVVGPTVELDRGIQQRVLAPLEHLLRNAVAHGIETPEQRADAGKPAAGVVTLLFGREGNDLVISVADDGAGLDLEALRKRAAERGLIAQSAADGVEEIARLILEPGLSAEDEVSAIPGRGVGLAAVNDAIEQISGSFAVETRAGRGTRFTARLPLTLSVMDAVLVELGGEAYVIPQATIEGVSRIERSDLEACYQGRGKGFSHGGHDYPVMHLGALLRPGAAPTLDERRWQPVLLARCGDRRVSLHVDNLRGSQRLLVKPLRPERASRPWLSGEAILPDGRAAPILELSALIGPVQEGEPP